MAETKMDGCKGDGEWRSDSTGPRDSDSSEISYLLPLLHNDDGWSTSTASPQTQGTMTIYEKGSPSRKRNPSQEREIEDTHMETKKPRFFTLFGFDIIIRDAAGDQGTNVTVYQNPSRKANPNQEREIEETHMETKKPRIFTLFGFDILIPDEADQGTNINTVHQNPPRNPNSHQEEEEEEAPALIPQGFHPRIFKGIQQHPILLFEKELQCSDVLPNHNRLLITGSYELMMALTEEERRKVEINKADYLRVLTTDANGAVYTLHLKRWAGSGAIVLKRDWSKFVAANKLQKGDSVEGWGYRVGTEFRLALSIIRKSK